MRPRQCPTFVLLLLAGLLVGCLNAREESVNDPGAAPDPAWKLATFGGGCFWCTEALLETLDGVKDVVSGYSGGHKENPTYQEVCAETTGHAEVVQVTFDPETVTYRELLAYFWQAHDPTTLNRQGNDVGTRYRSIILYHDPEQKKAAEESRAVLATELEDPVVTEIVPFEKFHVAEDYHQDYFRKNPSQSYCFFVIRPKLSKFLKETSGKPRDDRK